MKWNLYLQERFVCLEFVETGACSQFVHRSTGHNETLTARAEAARPLETAKAEVERLVLKIFAA